MLLNGRPSPRGLELSGLCLGITMFTLFLPAYVIFGGRFDMRVEIASLKPVN